MNCPSDVELEMLRRGETSWWRAFLRRRHVRGCPDCRLRMEALAVDEQLVDDVRNAWWKRSADKPQSPRAEG